MSRKLTQILLLQICFIGHTLSQTNLVSNGGFEANTNGWTTFNSSPSVASFKINTEEAYEGNNCFLASITTLGDNPWAIQAKKAGWAVTEGVTYRIILWAKSGTDGKAINFTIGKNTANYDEYAAKYGLSLTTNWEAYEIIFEAPVTTTDDITLALHFTDIGDFYIDNFQVYELNGQVKGAEVSSSGTLVTVNFFEELQYIEENEIVPFIIYTSENINKNVTTVSQTWPNEFRIVLSDKVRKDELITVEYIPGNLITRVGTEIEAFTIEAENNSSQQPSVIQQNKLNSNQIYPNPATDIIFLDQEIGNFDATIQIFSSIGTIQETYQLETGKHHAINIADLPSGIYIMQIIIEGNQPLIGKFIKE